MRTRLKNGAGAPRFPVVVITFIAFNSTAPRLLKEWWRHTIRPRTIRSIAFPLLLLRRCRLPTQGGADSVRDPVDCVIGVPSARTHAHSSASLESDAYGTLDRIGAGGGRRE